MSITRTENGKIDMKTNKAKLFQLLPPKGNRWPAKKTMQIIIMKYSIMLS